MKYRIPFLASVLAALLMGLPLAGVMEYAARKAEPRRAELMEKGVKPDLEAFMKQHSLSNNDMRFMVSPKGMPFLNTWLSYSVSVGLTVGIFLLLRSLLDRLIRKRESPNKPLMRRRSSAAHQWGATLGPRER